MKTQQTLGHWIRVKPGNYLEPIEEVDIGILISPYDIPDGIRGGYDEHLKRFVVEFRYMVDEEYRREDGDDGVSIRLGKHSSRIVGIEIDVDRLRASGVTVAVENRKDAYTAMGHAIRNVQNLGKAKARRRENYLVAHKVFEDNQDGVFANMRHALAG